MHPNFVRKIKALAIICFFTCLAGIIYQLIDVKRVDYNSLLIGFPLGVLFAVLELFVFAKERKLLRQWSFTRVFLFKTFTYTIAVYAITISITIITGMVEGRKLAELPAFLLSTSQFILVFYTLVIYSLLIFFLQINHLMGDGVLWKFITGKYYKPREEARIFMFLDMKSSTTIAEQLGHEQFYKLLNELFHEMSQPILQTNAEIYQYIGDEIILTWTVEDGLKNENCLRAFFLFQDRLQERNANYVRNFGVSPEFKAGLHFGNVISAQIGDLKREIVYNGDVLNTTSRIQNECNKYHRNLLVSGGLMRRLQQVKGYQWEWIDAVLLRGKEKEVELFSVIHEN